MDGGTGGYRVKRLPKPVTKVQTVCESTGCFFNKGPWCFNVCEHHVTPSCTETLGTFQVVCEYWYSILEKRLADLQPNQALWAKTWSSPNPFQVVFARPWAQLSQNNRKLVVKKTTFTTSGRVMFQHIHGLKRTMPTRRVGIQPCIYSAYKRRERDTGQ